MEPTVDASVAAGADAVDSGGAASAAAKGKGKVKKKKSKRTVTTGKAAVSLDATAAVIVSGAGDARAGAGSVPPTMASPTMTVTSHHVNDDEESAAAPAAAGGGGGDNTGPSSPRSGFLSPRLTMPRRNKKAKTKKKKRKKQSKHHADDGGGSSSDADSASDDNDDDDDSSEQRKKKKKKKHAHKHATTTTTTAAAASGGKHGHARSKSGGGNASFVAHHASKFNPLRGSTGVRSLPSSGLELRYRGRAATAGAGGGGDGDGETPPDTSAAAVQAEIDAAVRKHAEDQRRFKMQRDAVEGFKSAMYSRNKKHSSNLRRVVDDVSSRRRTTAMFGVGMLGVLLMIVQLEVGYDYANDAWYDHSNSSDDGDGGGGGGSGGTSDNAVLSEALKWANFLSSLVLVLLILEYYWFELDIKQRSYSITQGRLSTLLASKMLIWLPLELAICIVSPLPFLLDQRYTLLMFLRFYLVGRVMRDQSMIYRNRRELFRAECFTSYDFVNINATFILKTYFRQWNVAVVTLTTLVCGGSMAFAIHIIERDLQFDGFWVSAYLTTITMTTVGYGDYSAETSVGRLIMCVTGVAGLILSSFIVATTTNWTQLSAQQEEAASFVMLLRFRNEERELAAQVIQNAWRLWSGGLRVGDLRMSAGDIEHTHETSAAAADDAAPHHLLYIPGTRRAGAGAAAGRDDNRQRIESVFYKTSALLKEANPVAFAADLVYKRKLMRAIKHRKSLSGIKRSLEQRLSTNVHVSAALDLNSMRADTERRLDVMQRQLLAVENKLDSVLELLQQQQQQQQETR